MEVIVLDSILKNYGNNTVLKDITFRLEKGENLAILGPNGSGKSTLLKLMAGIIYPSSGNITVLGHKPYLKERNFLARISFINPQKSRLIFDVSPMDNFMLFGSAYGLPFKVIKNRVKELSEMLNISEKLNTPVRTLSFGERVKVEIITGLLPEPEILLMDEPFIGIDFLTETALKKFLSSVNSQLVLTSHVFDILEGVIHKVIIIDRGNMLYYGSFERLIERFKDKKVVIFTCSREPSLPYKFTKMAPYEYSVIVSNGEAEDVYKNLRKESVIEKIEIRNPDVEDIIGEFIGKQS